MVNMEKSCASIIIKNSFKVIKTMNFHKELNFSEGKILYF